MHLSSSLITTFALLLSSHVSSATVLEQSLRPNFKRDACIPVPNGPCQDGWANECGYYAHNVLGCQNGAWVIVESCQNEGKVCTDAVCRDCEDCLTPECGLDPPAPPQ